MGWLEAQPPEEWRSTLLEIRSLEEARCTWGTSGCGRLPASHLVALKSSESFLENAFLVCPRCAKVYEQVTAAKDTAANRVYDIVRVIPI